MTKIKMGIPGWMTGDRSFGVSVSYAQFIRDFFDAEMHIITPDMEFRSDLTHLLLPGGADILPSRYDMFPEYGTGSPNIFLEDFDKKKLPLYINNKTKIFGICRGMQSLAVHFGAILDQDMYHETNDSSDKGKTVHSIREQVFKHPSEKIKVNSRHHQAVIITDKAKENGVIIEAVHTSDSTIEAISILDHNIFAVQFHPEDMYERATLTWLYGKLKKHGIL